MTSGAGGTRANEVRRQPFAEPGSAGRERKAARGVRLKLLCSEALRSLAANLSTTVAATLTVLIGVFLLGLFIAFGSCAQAFGDQKKDKLLVKVFFCTDSTCKKAATHQQINAVRENLTAEPLVKEVVLVSKEEALERMGERQPELSRLAGNPLPDA